MDKDEINLRRRQAINRYKEGYTLDEAAEEFGFKSSSLRTYIIHEAVLENKENKKAWHEGFKKEWDQAIHAIKGNEAKMSKESRLAMEWEKATKQLLG